MNNLGKQSQEWMKKIMGNYEIPVDLDYKNPFHHARSLSLGVSDQGYGYGNKESSSLFFKE